MHAYRFIHWLNAINTRKRNSIHYDFILLKYRTNFRTSTIIFLSLLHRRTDEKLWKAFTLIFTSEDQRLIS